MIPKQQQQQQLLMLNKMPEVGADSCGEDGPAGASDYRRTF